MPELIRGANISLTQELPALKVITVGVQWKTIDTVLDDDLLMGAVLCGDDGKALSETELVFFNQLSNSTNTVAMGDDRQQVDIDLSAVPAGVESIDVVVWVNSSPRTMAALSSMSARVIDTVEGNQLVYTEDLAPHLGAVKAACLVQVYRHKGNWKVRAKGEGWREGIAGMMKGYGLT